MVCRGPSDDRVDLHMLQRRVPRMESLAIDVAHRLELEVVVEASEDRVVAVADQQEDPRASHLAGHEVADVRVDLLEVLSQVGETIYHDHDLAAGTQLPDRGEQLVDVRDARVGAAEPGESQVDLLQIIAAKALGPGDVDVVLVTGEFAEKGGLPKMAPPAYRTRNRDLVPESIQVRELLHTSHTTVHGRGNRIAAI